MIASIGALCVGHMQTVRGASSADAKGWLYFLNVYRAELCWRYFYFHFSFYSPKPFGNVSVPQFCKVKEKKKKLGENKGCESWQITQMEKASYGSCCELLSPRLDPCVSSTYSNPCMPVLSGIASVPASQPRFLLWSCGLGESTFGSVDVEMWEEGRGGLAL